MYACSLHPHDGERKKVKRGTKRKNRWNHVEQRYKISH
nr:MAG TPA: hypothetical protein [Caudoviricetes sp.]